MSGLGSCFVTPTRRPQPADCVPDGMWPENLPPDSAPDVRLAAGIATRLKEKVDLLTLREAEERTGISRSTINKIINGRAWPTIHTPPTWRQGSGRDYGKRTSLTVKTPKESRVHQPDACLPPRANRMSYNRSTFVTPASIVIEVYQIPHSSLSNGPEKNPMYLMEMPPGSKDMSDSEERNP